MTLTIRAATAGLVVWMMACTFCSILADGPATGNNFEGIDFKHDWPWWRGPNLDGAAVNGPLPPLRWSEKENVAWSVPIVGRGHGSPTVVGDHVYIITADLGAQVQALECYDRKTGKNLWKSPVHEGNFQSGENGKSSHASTSPACDGKRVFVSLVNNNAAWATAFTRDGEQIWQTKVGGFVNHQGYGASPLLWGPLVIVNADNKGGGSMCGLDRATGKEVWHVDRPKKPNYPSPVIHHIDGKDQLIMTGCDMVSSFDPLSGSTLWEHEGATTECVISTVTDGERIFTSGGYPKNHVSAMRADGSGIVDWENNSRVYVPSMICHDGYLYGVLDAGVAVCWKSDTGAEAWKGRLNGTFSSSLVRVGDYLLATNEEGNTFVFKANPKKYEAVGQNKLGDETFSTPVVVDGQIFHRYVKMINGQRQEFLACIASSK